MFLNYTLVLKKKYTVICLVPEGFEYLDVLRSNNIDYETIKIRNYYDLLATYNFIRLYKKFKPEFVFSHNGRFNSVINISSSLLRLKGTIAICHGDVKRLASFSQTLVVNTALKETLLENKIKDVKILPNFIEIQKTKLESKTTNNETFTFGVFSRLSTEKCVIDAIKAVEKLSAIKGAKFKLIIGGMGPEFSTLSNYVKENNLQSMVSLSGWVSDKSEFYNSVDCYILTSSRESFGLTILEAYNHSLPVISSRTEGPSDIIQDGINGLLYDPNNISQLVSLMAQVFEDPYLKAKIASQGFQTLHHRYTKRIFQEKLFDLLSL